jgi:hypothetical protein
MLYEVYNGNNATLLGKYVYEHTPSIKYYNMTKDERRALWSETFDKKKAYLKTCRGGFGQYDHIPRAVCNMYANQDVLDLSFSEKSKRTSVMNMCEQTYCSRFIVQKENDTLPAWCNIAVPKEGEAPAKVVLDKPDVITNVLLILIILLIVIIVFVGINNTAGTRPVGT